ncbi:YfdX family protein [Candidatus Odyssella thessalonicensis]|uniref:YfdX family protein n=1 Tax=Candidatus Odyssella thessalonicensis TaxID=84647 RepID=UPI000225C088|nr:YfdX family protein [Candidatus Odyssella thessalonicensis]
MVHIKSIFKGIIANGQALNIGLNLVIYISAAYASHPPSLPASAQASISQSTVQERERQRQKVEEKAQKMLVPNAATAIKETRSAIEELHQAHHQEALEAIERAIGKLDVLLANHPEEAWLPADFSVEVIDLAPIDIETIKEISKTAKKAVRHKDYPDGRLFLSILRSEIHIRNYSLPLAIYSRALKKAASLLEEKKANESKAVLLRALNTLIIIDQIIPLPLINADVMLHQAEREQEKDKSTALNLIANARHELERAKELGYINKIKDSQYESLDRAVHDLEKRLKRNKSITAVMKKLIGKLRVFLKDYYEEKRQSFHKLEP